MTKLFQWFKIKVFAVPTFGHLVMVACAVASYENIHGFFKALHDNELFAVGLGVAIGSALVMAAGLLSGMTWNWGNPRLRLIAIVTAALALLSGGVQAASYASHGLWWLWAGLLGLALPGIGELGIAIAVSAYEKEQKERRAAMADDEIEERINDAISYALGTIDISSAQRYVEEKAADILRHKMDEIVSKRLGQNPLSMPVVTDTVSPTSDKMSQSATIDIDTVVIDKPANNTMSTPIDSDKKRLSAQDRRIDMLSILPEFDTPSDIDYDKLATIYDVTARTIRRDIDELVSKDKLILNGVVKVKML